MRKILAILLAIILVASMVVPAFAATPTLNIKVPQISSIKFTVKLDENLEKAVANAVSEAVKKIDFSNIKPG